MITTNAEVTTRAMLSPITIAHIKRVLQFSAVKPARRSKPPLVLLVLVLALVSGQDDSTGCGREVCEPCPIGVVELEQQQQGYWTMTEREQEASQNTAQCLADLGNAKQDMVRFQDEAAQCQTQNQELQVQAQDAAAKHDREQKGWKQRSNNLARDLQEKIVAMQDIQQKRTTMTEELKGMKAQLEAKEAAKAIIAIDWELLNQRVEEGKVGMGEHFDTAVTAMKDLLDLIKEKCVFVMEVVFPQVTRFVEEDAIPFCKTSLEQAKQLWETLYGPYRQPVNDQVDSIRKSANAQYQTHLSPLVKQYELDVYATKAQAQLEVAMDQAQKYRVQLHEEMVKIVKSTSQMAAQVLAKENGPEWIVEGLQAIHDDAETWVSYAGYAFLAMIALFMLQRMFRGKKKKTLGYKRPQSKPI